MAAVATITPGQQIPLSYQYFADPTSSSPTCQYSGAYTSPVVRVYYSLTLYSATATSITVTPGIATGSYFNGATLDTEVEFYGCGTSPGSSPAALTTVTSSPYAFTGGSMASQSICYFQLFTRITGATDWHGYSGIVPFMSTPKPSWSGIAQSRIGFYGDSCIQITWDPLSDSPGAPIQCYEISMTTKLISNTAVVTSTVSRECTSVDALMTLYKFCSLSNLFSYQFSIKAVNQQGSATRSTPWFSVGDISADATLTYIQADLFLPTSTTGQTFSAGLFPTFSLTKGFSLSGVTGPSRLLVGVLHNRGTLDSTRTIILPDTIVGSSNILVGPLGVSSPSPFVLTYTYGYRNSHYLYDLIVPEGGVKLAGKYSLVTYSVQGGGLRGQYWSNIAFSGVPKVSRVDPLLDLNWGTSAIFTANNVQVFDHVSIRWTGFIEARFSEMYTLYFETKDHIMVWIDNALVINHWDDMGPCSGVCAAQYQLQQSILSETSNVGQRKFHCIRIDMKHARGATQSTPAGIKLRWSSPSQEYEVIPTANLFVGYPIYGYSGSNYALPTIIIQPAGVSATRSTVNVTATTVAAGDTFFVYISLLDQYGNIVQTGSDEITVTATPTGAGSAVLKYAAAVEGKSGSYFASFTLTATGQYSLASTVQLPVGGSGTNLVTTYVTIVPGDIKQITATLPMGTLSAGINFDLQFSFMDAFNQAVSVTPTMDFSHFTVTATWTGDPIGLSRVTPDDTFFRLQRYSTSFNPSRVFVTAGSNIVTASLNLPFQGTYTLSFIYGDEASPATGSTALAVYANTANISPYNSVVVTSPFPPSTMISGTPYSFDLQVRDTYYNSFYDSSITSAVTPEIDFNGGSGVSCFEKSSPNYGLYTCTITPTTSGAATLWISINNMYVGYLSQSGAVVRNIQGPWSVLIAAGTLVASQSIVSGVQKTYEAGIPSEITILQRDINNNNIAVPLSPSPIVSVQICGSVASLETVMYNLDGTITVPFIPTVKGTGCNFEVSLDSLPAAVPSTFAGSISVLEGDPSVFGTTCTRTNPTGSNTYAVNSVAPVQFTCSIKDSQSNAVTVATTPQITFYLRNQLDHSVTYSTTYDSVNNRYEVQPTVAGSYDYYAIMAQPSGLLAEYFQGADFTQLIGLSSGIKSDARFPGDPSIQYTRIDPKLNFDWAGGVDIDGIFAQSIRWSGLINLDAATSAKVNGNGAIRVSINGVVVLDLLGPNAPVTGAFDSTITLLANTQSNIEILYVPSVNDAQIVLKYTTSSNYLLVVPPSYLYTLLAIQSTQSGANPLLADGGSAVQVTSALVFPYNLIVGQPASYYVYLRDIYGNNLAVSSCTSIAFSLTDASNTAITGVISAGATATCSTDLAGTTAGTYFVGTITVGSPVEGATITATITPATGSAFTLTSSINVASPLDPTPSAR